MKHLLHKWTLLILALLKPLGIWGVLGFAAVDAAFLGMPLDAIVAGYVWANPHRLLLYSAMAAAGLGDPGAGGVSLRDRAGEGDGRFGVDRQRFDLSG